MLTLRPTPDLADTVRPPDEPDDLKTIDLGGGYKLAIPHHLAVTLYWNLHDYLHRVDEKRAEAAKRDLERRRAEQAELCRVIDAMWPGTLRSRNETTSQQRRAGAIRAIAAELQLPIGMVTALVTLNRRRAQKPPTES